MDERQLPHERDDLALDETAPMLEMSLDDLPQQPRNRAQLPEPSLLFVASAPPLVEPTIVTPAPFSSPAPSPRPSGEQRRLRRTVVLLAAMTSAAAVFLSLVLVEPSWFGSLRSYLPGAPPPASATHAHQKSATSISSTKSSTDGPTIVAIEPSSGLVGQKVTIIGKDLFSASGYVVATFDGSVVPTSCATEQRCTAVVPAPKHGSSSESVQIRAASSVSNSVTFTYL